MNLTSKWLWVTFLVATVVFALAWDQRDFWLLVAGSGFVFSGLAIALPRIRTFSTVSASVVFSVALAELVLSSMPLHSASSGASFDQDYSYASGEYFDVLNGSSLGYTIRPGSYDARKVTQDGGEIYSVTYEIGPDGYRKSANVNDAQAFLFGGSYAFGEGLDRAATLSSFLTASGMKTKSYGVHGYGMHQSLKQIENGLGASDAGEINIALTSPFHAFRSSCQVAQSAGSVFYQVENGVAVESGLCPGGGLIGRVLSQSEIWNIILGISSPSRALNNDDIERYLAILKSMDKVSRDNGGQLLVAYIDGEKTLDGTDWSDSKIKNHLVSEGMRVVDVSLKERNLEYSLHELDRHPNKLANELRARLIISHLSSDQN